MLANKPIKKISTFLGITFAISCIFYFLIINAGGLEAKGGLYVFLLMWTPGLAGIATQLIYEHSIKGLGWKPGPFKYLALAYIIPLIYCLVVYGITWLTGLGQFPCSSFLKNLTGSYPGLSSPAAIAVYTLIMGTVGVLVSLFSGLGEEIGWRGLLVPEMAKILPFWKVGLFSGLIWAVWHMPLIFFSNYNLPGIPTWYAALMFMIMVVGISFVFAWLRLRSGSLWTAAMLHASHNLFVQSIFTPLTGQTAITPFIIDEFGCGLAIAISVLAIIFWKKRKELQLLSE
ncbi:CPBP family intramembrane glutamic endopeptidase [Leptolinea tardivitalis]|nr:CPBP family intramembrane glutamic endopeptidase [Leptolinea tardivitalis]GAP21649.1 CAAX protease self-immunity [Leptolinea tardivitalis]